MNSVQPSFRLIYGLENTTRSTIAGNKHKRLFVVIFCAMGRAELKGYAVLWPPRLSIRGIAKTCV